jgi:hypothetical protein
LRIVVYIANTANKMKITENKTERLWICPTRSTAVEIPTSDCLVCNVIYLLPTILSLTKCHYK